jgi:hypothetical protein
MMIPSFSPAAQRVLGGAIAFLVACAAAAAETKPTPPLLGPPGQGSAMDYGPFLSYSVLRPRDVATPVGSVKPAPRIVEGHPRPQTTDGGELVACKGITVHVGNDSAVCFDTDLLSLAGGWTGGFLDVRRSHLDRDKGDLAAIVPVPLKFSTNCDPGWAGSDEFVDPRPVDGGPLPPEQAHYRGLYRHGQKVVFSYTVRGADVLELDGSAAGLGHVAFTRTIHVGPSKETLLVNVCELEGAIGSVIALDTLQATAKGGAAGSSAAVLSKDGSDTLVAVVGAANGSTLAVFDNFRIQLKLPALAAPATFKIVIAQLPQADRSAFSGLLKAAGTIEDPQALCGGGPALWPQTIVTEGLRGQGKGAYAIDTVRLPENNPWKAWMRTTGFDFFSDGRAALCTWNGDVWIASGLDENLGHVTWKRFAAGLYDTLGLRIVNDEVYVLGRDQITRLHDLNGDGEADFYENFCNAWPASAVYHAFNLDLQTDSGGNFYFATCGNHAYPWMRLKGTVLKISKDGENVESLCSGLRAPNGLGIGPHDEIYCTDNQGNWVPADRINLIKPGGFYGFPYDPARVGKNIPKDAPTHFDLPLCWIRYPEPDNSAGAMLLAPPNWGPLSGHMLCTSFGKSAILGVLEEEVDGVAQGGVFKIPLKFDSGIMRARVGPRDGQVWVCGLGGWQSNAAHEGCFQRIRHTGKPANMPVALHVLPAALQITFSDALDKELAIDDQSYGIQQWVYDWHPAYGSADFKASDPKTPGHDTLAIKSVKLSSDRKTVTIETGPLKPVQQMAIETHLRAADGTDFEWEIDNTINRVPAYDGSRQ